MAFEYAGDLWVVSRAGGQARRLTSTSGVETDPHFSPDGSRIAFTATVAGNTDVYVVPTAGGEPTRLTYHPGIDRVRGWSPDGKRVIFGSPRLSPPQQSYLRLWSVSVDGGLPDPLPMPRAFTGTYSPDGKRVAYEEFSTAFIPQWYEASEWRHYRWGPVAPRDRVKGLLDPLGYLHRDVAGVARSATAEEVAAEIRADYSVEKLPWTNSNDTDPMWIGNTVYFLSDRNFTVNLFSYALDTKTLKQLTQHADFDIRNASAGPDAIVYEQAGYVHLFDIKTGQARQLTIEVTGDLPWARPQMKRVASMIRSAALSPTGVRAVFEARGDIFTVPAEKGDYRNITRSTAVHDRDPVWSPDGTQLAWFSDASGEYQLMIGDQSGITKPRAVALPSAAFFSELAWSPDGKHLSFQDNSLNLWSLELASGKATKLDVDTYDDPSRNIDPVWSPDSRWLAYSKNLDNHLRAIYLYSLGDGKAYQVNNKGYVVWVGAGNSWKDGITKNLWQTRLPASQSPWGYELAWGHPIVDRPLAGQPGQGVGINQIIGNVFPDYRFSISNDFSYKKFTLYALLDATIGNSINNQGEGWGLLSVSSAHFDQASKTVETAKPVGY